MKFSTKSSYFLGVSPFALTLWFLNPAHALQETYESRALALQGLSISQPDSLHLQQEAKLATVALDGTNSPNTKVALPAAVSSIKSRLGLTSQVTVTNYVDSLSSKISGLTGTPLSQTNLTSEVTNLWDRINSTHGSSILSDLNAQLTSLQSTDSPPDLASAVSHISSVLGGSTGGVYENANAINAAMDGVQSMSGLTSFIVTAVADNSGPTVRIVGDDGTPNQTYSFTYSSPIASGAPITLANDNKSITFINNSGGSINSVLDLVTYLAGAYPINFVLSNTTTTKISALKSLLGATNGGPLGTNTSVYGQALTAKVPVPTNSTVDSLLDGVQSMSGISSFIVMASAINNSGMVSIIGNDGTPGQSYTINTTNSGINLGDGTGGTTSILAGATITLTGPSNRTITLLNNSGAPITSAADLASYLATAHPVNAVLKENTDAKATALQAFLGGTASNAMGNAATLDAALLASPTGVIATDLATVASEIVAAPSGVLGNDVQTINNLLNGTASGSTIESRINTQIAALESGATRLSTAVSDVNAAIGGSSATLTRVRSVNALLDGVQSLSGLTSFTVMTAATNTSGTISVIGNDGTPGRTYSLTYSSPIANGGTFTLTNGGTGNTITFVNNSGGSISSAAALASYLETAYPVNATIKATSTSKATALKAFLGGTGSSAMGNAVALDAALLASPTGVIATDLATVASEIVAAPSGVLENDLQTINNSLIGTTNLASPLETRVNVISADLDNSLNLLPLDSTYATVTSAATIVGPNVEITIGSGLGGANGTYVLSSYPILNNTLFTLINSNTGDSIVLYNRSGTNLSSQFDALRYLASMYPVNSKIAFNASDKISSLKSQVGGPASSLRVQIAAIDAALLESPTGILKNDLNSVRAQIITSPGRSLESDVSTIDSLLDGTTSGSTVEDRINTQIAAIENGATQLSTAVSDVQSIVDMASATDGTGVWSVAIGSGSSPSDLYSQIQQFLALFNTNNWNNTGHTSITFTCNGTAPTSLADLINKVTSTS